MLNELLMYLPRLSLCTLTYSKQHHLSTLTPTSFLEINILSLLRTMSHAISKAEGQAGVYFLLQNASCCSWQIKNLGYLLSFLAFAVLYWLLLLSIRELLHGGELADCLPAWPTSLWLFRGFDKTDCSKEQSQLLGVNHLGTWFMGPWPSLNSHSRWPEIGMYLEYLWAADWPELPAQCAEHSWDEAFFDKCHCCSSAQWILGPRWKPHQPTVAGFGWLLSPILGMEQFLLCFVESVQLKWLFDIYLMHFPVHSALQDTPFLMPCCGGRTSPFSHLYGPWLQYNTSTGVMKIWILR